MNKGLLILVVAAGLFPIAAEGKDARGVIQQSGTVAYAGVCHFHLRKGGSFRSVATTERHFSPLSPTFP